MKIPFLCQYRNSSGSVAGVNPGYLSRIEVVSDNTSGRRCLLNLSNKPNFFTSYDCRKIERWRLIQRNVLQLNQGKPLLPDFELFHVSGYNFVKNHCYLAIAWLSEISCSSFDSAWPASIDSFAIVIPCCNVFTLSPAINTAAVFINTISRCGP